MENQKRLEMKKKVLSNLEEIISLVDKMKDEIYLTRNSREGFENKLQEQYLDAVLIDIQKVESFFDRYCY